MNKVLKKSIFNGISSKILLCLIFASCATSQKNSLAHYIPEMQKTLRK